MPAKARPLKKYLVFAKKAEKEGMVNIAGLFRATAAAEHIHPERHPKARNGGGSTAGNNRVSLKKKQARLVST